MSTSKKDHSTSDNPLAILILLALGVIYGDIGTSLMLSLGPPH